MKFSSSFLILKVNDDVSETVLVCLTSLFLLVCLVAGLMICQLDSRLDDLLA